MLDKAKYHILHCRSNDFVDSVFSRSKPGALVIFSLEQFWLSSQSVWNVTWIFHVAFALFSLCIIQLINWDMRAFFRRKFWYSYWTPFAQVRRHKLMGNGLIGAAGATMQCLHEHICVYVWLYVVYIYIYKYIQKLYIFVKSLNVVTCVLTIIRYHAESDNKERNVHEKGLCARLFSKPFNHYIFCWDCDRGVEGEYSNKEKLLESAL